VRSGIPSSHFVHNLRLTNHGIYIPPCLAGNRHNPGRGYHLREEAKVGGDDQGQSFGGCIWDNS